MINIIELPSGGSFFYNKMEEFEGRWKKRSRGAWHGVT